MTLLELDSSSAYLNQLRWKCRRGMLELDLILLAFLENHYLYLPAGEKLIFECLLEMPDPQLYAWLMHQEVPEDATWHLMIGKIRNSLLPSSF